MDLIWGLEGPDLGLEGPGVGLEGGVWSGGVVAAVPLAVGVLEKLAEVKILSPGSSRVVLVGL